MRERPFRFSVQLAMLSDRRDWRRRVQRAESLGYDMVVTADHLTDCAPPLVSLAATAQMSDSLRLGVLVANNDLRHPSLLAREAVAVDIFSDGRLELGLGAGYAREEYDRAGLSFEPAGRRLAKLEESVSIMRRLLDGQSVDESGEFYSLKAEHCESRPVQAHVPLILGGGRKGILALAAARADTVAIASGGRPRSAANLDQQVNWLRARCDALDRRPELQLFIHVVRLASSRPTSVKADLASALPELSQQEAVQSPYALAGSPESIADELLARRERWGITHYTVRGDDMDAFAPVMRVLR